MHRRLVLLPISLLRARVPHRWPFLDRQPSSAHHHLSPASQPLRAPLQTAHLGPRTTWADLSTGGGTNTFTRLSIPANADNRRVIPIKCCYGPALLLRASIVHSLDIAYVILGRNHFARVDVTHTPVASSEQIIHM